VLNGEQAALLRRAWYERKRSSPQRIEGLAVIDASAAATVGNTSFIEAHCNPAECVQD
jgi:hypothetical protein